MRNIKNTTLLSVCSLALTFCGQPPQEPTQSQAQPQSDGIEHQAPNTTEKEVVIEHRKIDDDRIALQIRTSSMLPECQYINSRQLVYVVEDDTMYECTDKVWTPKLIDTDTIQKSTEPPESSSNYKNPYTWIDPKTQKKWSVQGKISYAFVDNGAVCSLETMPSASELQDSLARGLDIFLKNLQLDIKFIWSKSPSDTMTESHRRAVRLNGSVDNVAKTARIRAICLENP